MLGAGVDGGGKGGYEGDKMNEGDIKNFKYARS